MSKKHSLTFAVTVSFADGITAPKSIAEIADNIAVAIQDATNGQGIAPDDCETFTTHVEVSPLNIEGLKYTVKLKIV